MGYDKRDCNNKQVRWDKMDKVVLPMDFAKEAHGDQKYGDQPYIYHLEQVIDRFRDFSYCIVGGSDIIHFSDSISYSNSEDSIMTGIIETAILSHDLLEDTNVTYDQLLDLFGRNVADLVHAVTDESGETRKERKAKTLPKTREYGYLAVAIKLCDRIANVENCSITENDDLMEMYREEYDLFKQTLYLSEDGLDDIWDYLDELMMVNV